MKCEAQMLHSYLVALLSWKDNGNGLRAGFICTSLCPQNIQTSFKNGEFALWFHTLNAIKVLWLFNHGSTEGQRVFEMSIVFPIYPHFLLILALSPRYVEKVSKGGGFAAVDPSIQEGLSCCSTNVFS